MFEVEPDYYLYAGLPFYYNLKSKFFVIDQVPIKDVSTVLDISVFTFNPDKSRYIRINEDIKYLKIDDSVPIYNSGYGEFVVMPSLRKYIGSLENAKRDQIYLSVLKSMTQVLSVFGYNDKLFNDIAKLSKRYSGDNYRKLHSAPGVSFDKNGICLMRTLGDCSCLEPDPYTYIIRYNNVEAEHSYESNISLPMAYKFHNVEQLDDQKIRARALSLYAGIGTLAWHFIQD